MELRVMLTQPYAEWRKVNPPAKITYFGDGDEKVGLYMARTMTVLIECERIPEGMPHLFKFKDIGKGWRQATIDEDEADEVQKWLGENGKP